MLYHTLVCVGKKHIFFVTETIFSVENSTRYVLLCPDTMTKERVYSRQVCGCNCLFIYAVRRTVVDGAKEIEGGRTPRGKTDRAAPESTTTAKFIVTEEKSQDTTTRGSSALTDFVVTANTGDRDPERVDWRRTGVRLRRAGRPRARSGDRPRDLEEDRARHTRPR